jgi:ATP-dependent Clp protease ATP-binding subunit ClpB
LADRGYDPVFGARPLKRVLRKELEDKVALAVLDGAFTEGSVVHVDVDPSSDGLVLGEAGAAVATRP